MVEEVKCWIVKCKGCGYMPSYGDYIPHFETENDAIDALNDNFAEDLENGLCHKCRKKTNDRGA